MRSPRESSCYSRRLVPAKKKAPTAAYECPGRNPARASKAKGSAASEVSRESSAKTGRQYAASTAGLPERAGGIARDPNIFDLQSSYFWQAFIQGSPNRGHRRARFEKRSPHQEQSA